MHFNRFSDVYWWQAMCDRDWYSDEEYYRDCAFGFKRTFFKDTEREFTVDIYRSGNDGIWKWDAWRGKGTSGDTWFEHRKDYENLLGWDVGGFFIESMQEAYDALVQHGWMDSE